MENKTNFNSTNNPAPQATNNSSQDNRGGSRKGLILSLISIAVIIIIAGTVLYSYRNESNKEIARIESEKQELNLQLQDRDSLVGQWVSAFNEIERDLGVVKQKENVLTMSSNDPEFTKARRDAILEDIRYINTLMEENKQRIASLSKQLKNSGLKIAALDEKIKMLDESLQLRTTEIAELKTMLVNKDFEVSQLNEHVGNLESTVVEREALISQQTDELNKAFVTSGTYKELKERGLLTKEGGFLGIGRKEAIIEDFGDSLFTQINITKTTTIPVNSKDATLITEHPTSSYAMVKDNDEKIAYIEIKNPDEFWKVSKYAVVEKHN